MADAQTVEWTSLVNTLNTKIDALNSQVSILNAPLQQKYQEAVIARYDAELSIMRTTVHAYKWHLNASAIMMWMVIIVVVVGLIFSGLELFVFARPNGANSTELEVSLQKTKITSSIAGLIILAMSFAFVLVFVDKIYTMQPAPVIDAGGAPVSSPQK